MDRTWIQELVKLADTLDNKGLKTEADELDGIVTAYIQMAPLSPAEPWAHQKRMEEMRGKMEPGVPLSDEEIVTKLKNMPLSQIEGTFGAEAVQSMINDLIKKYKEAGQQYAL